MLACGFSRTVLVPSEISNSSSPKFISPGHCEVLNATKSASERVDVCVSRWQYGGIACRAAAGFPGN